MARKKGQLRFPEYDSPLGKAAETAEDDGPKEFADYEERYVAVVDILGFKELVKKSSSRNQNDLPSHQRVSQIYAALNNDFQSARDYIAHVEQTEDVNLRINTFSDFVVVSCRASPAGLVLVAIVVLQLCKDWLSKNYLSRGAIAKGLVVHREAQQDNLSAVVFGPAFVRAHEIESNISNFPRVILCPAARKDWEECVDDRKGSHRKYAPLIHRCEDGPYCVDLFCQIREKGFRIGGKRKQPLESRQFRDALQFHLNESLDEPRFYSKARWLAEHFNSAVKKSSRLRIQFR